MTYERLGQNKFGWRIARAIPGISDFLPTAQVRLHGNASPAFALSDNGEIPGSSLRRRLAGFPSSDPTLSERRTDRATRDRRKIRKRPELLVELPNDD
jgi:hypothetical protein